MNFEFLRKDRTARPSDLIGIVGLAAIYAGFGYLGLKLGAVANVATPLWLPAGFSLAALFLLGYRLWPGVLIGSLVVNLWATQSLWGSLGTAIGSTVEGLLAANLLHRLGFSPAMERRKDVTIFLAWAVLPTTFLSALVGVTNSWLVGIVPSSQFLSALVTWWTGDALGDLVIAPMIFLFLAQTGRLKGPAPYLCLLATIGACLHFSSGSALGQFVNPYLLLPVLVWITLRDAQPGAALGNFLLSTILVSGTLLGAGWFAGDSHVESIFAVQLFVGLVAITFLYVGAQVAEKRLVEHSLRNSLVARDDFVAMVSHDLRNPLTNVLLQANLLSRSMADHPSAVRSANLINMSGLQMQNIIERILDVSSLEAGTFSLQRLTIDVDSLIHQCVDSQKSLLEAKSISFFAESRLPQRAKVYCDTNRVLQVFANLFENAVRFTPDSGMIRLSAFPFQSAACFAVEDSGPGIEEEQLAHLFDRFWHGPPGSRSKGLGFGLGLHIAKGIVESHGGQIWAANREHGIGAAFLFTLPLAPAVVK